MLHRVDVKELAFGLFLIALALVAFASTRALSVGTAADMGPGFVPRALAWVILGFGAAFCVTSLLKAPQPLPAPAWRPLAAILAAIAAVRGAVLHPGADCRLRRLRAGRRHGHGARALAPARCCSARVLAALLGAAVREGAGPAVQALAVVPGAVLAPALAPGEGHRWSCSTTWRSVSPRRRAGRTCCSALPA